MSTSENSLSTTGLRRLLLLALAGQFGLALFEATFALFSMQMWSYGPGKVGTAFMVCGLVMTIAQLGIASSLGRCVGQMRQVAFGFALLGSALGALAVARGTSVVLVEIALLAFGVALIGPNIATLISLRGGAATGAALGVQSTANGVGQTLGTVLGGVLFAWQMHAPFALAAALLLPVSGLALWWGRRATSRT